MTAPTLSFGMIVRDGAATLRKCLGSVASLADELIVVDTGSSDDTVSIAREYGARVVEVAWTGDFAAARNIYVAMARGTWILSLDADEWLPGAHVDRIRAAVGARPPTAFGLTVRNFFHHHLEWPGLLAPSEFGAQFCDELSWYASRTIRLFPRVPGLTYQFPVHESLVPAARRLGVRMRRSDVVIHHREHSHAHSGRPEHKVALYRALGQSKVARFPRYARGHLELARIDLDNGDWEAAEARLKQCLSLSPTSTLASYCLGQVLLQTRRWRDLSRHLGRAPMAEVDRRYLEGRRLLGVGRSDPAARYLEQVLLRKPGYWPAAEALRLARGSVAEVSTPGLPRIW